MNVLCAGLLIGIGFLGNVDTLLRVPGWDPKVQDATVLLLEPDFLSVTAYDAKTGWRLWTSKFQENANGVQSLHPVGDRLFVYAGNRLVVLVIETGRVIARRNVYYQRDRKNLGCWFEEVEGACALACQCRLQFLSCLDGAPIGPEFQNSEICFEPMDDRDIGGCTCYPGAWPLGRAGNLLMASIEDTDKRVTGPNKSSRAVVAIDASTGKEVWRSEALGVSSSAIGAWGASEGGEACWLREPAGTLMIFECQTGRMLAHRTDCGAGESAADTGHRQSETPGLPGLISRGEHLLVAATRTEVRILDLETRKELARFDGEYTVLGVEGRLGAGRVVMTKTAEGKPEEVWLLRIR